MTSLSSVRVSLAAANISAADGSLNISVDETGIYSMRAMGQDVPLRGGLTDLTRGTLTTPSVCSILGNATLLVEKEGSAELSRDFTCKVPRPPPRKGFVHVAVTVKDTFITAPHSVKIATSIVAAPSAPLFSSALRTGLMWSQASESCPTRFWLPWNKGCVNNRCEKEGLVFCSVSPRGTNWTNPLSVEELPPSSVLYRYGAADGYHTTPIAGWLPAVGAKDGFSLPIATLLPEPAEAATDSKGTMALLALHHARPRACACTVALLALNSLVRGNHLARPTLRRLSPTHPLPNYGRYRRWRLARSRPLGPVARAPAPRGTFELGLRARATPPRGQRACPLLLLTPHRPRGLLPAGARLSGGRIPRLLPAADRRRGRHELRRCDLLLASPASRLHLACISLSMVLTPSFLILSPAPPLPLTR